MFCPKCGSQLPDGAAFCGSCGARIPRLEGSVHGAGAPASAVPPSTVQAASAPSLGSASAQSPSSATAAAPASSAGIPKLAFLALAAFALVALLVFAVRGCGPAPSNLPDLSGHYEPASDELFHNFAIYEADFSTDGTCVLEMDYDYAARYVKDGETYRFEITGGAENVGPITSVQMEHALEETRNAYKISAVLNADNTLTFTVKAKSGYIYFADETCVFEKR